MKRAVKNFLTPAFVVLLLLIFFTNSVFADYTVAAAEKVNYIVKYVDMDDNEIAHQSTSIDYYVGQEVTVTAIKIIGYTLISDPTKELTLDSDISKNVIIFKYDLTKYNITYNLGGGSASPDNPTSYTIKSNPITLNNPARAGYDFLGWDGTGLSGNTTSVTIPTGSTGDRTFTANWSEPVPYSVSYVLNGGTVNGTNPATYNVESDDITLVNPERSEYEFEGWSGTGIDGRSLSFTIPKGSTGDRTYTASWSDPFSYSITYNLNGGKVSGTNPETYSIESLAITLINPKKSGYNFTGWSGTGIDGKSSNVIIPGGSSGNRTYTANWSDPINYSITYDLNGGKVNGTNPKTYNVESSSIKLINPAKEGYIFEGWSGTGISGKSKSVSIPKGSTGDRKYTANWSLITYTVMFAAGEHGSIEGKTSYKGLKSGDKTPDAPVVKADEGWSFTGWSPKVAESVTGNATYTAGYEVTTFTVTFADYDGTVLSTQTVNWGTGAKAPESPSREGFTFTGWDKPFDSIKADTLVTALYNQIYAPAGASVGPAVSPSVHPTVRPTPTQIQQEPIPLTGGDLSSLNWIWIAAAVLGLLLLWLLLSSWFSVIPIAERVFNNRDGTYSIHWGYNNRKLRRYTIGKGKSVVSVIEGKIISSSSNAPVIFEKGRVRNALSIIADKDSHIEWRIRHRKASIDLSKIDK